MPSSFHKLVILIFILFSNHRMEKSLCADTEEVFSIIWNTKWQKISHFEVWKNLHVWNMKNFICIWNALEFYISLMKNQLFLSSEAHIPLHFWYKVIYALIFNCHNFFQHNYVMRQMDASFGHGLILTHALLQIYVIYKIGAIWKVLA